MIVGAEESAKSPKTAAGQVSSMRCQDGQQRARNSKPAVQRLTASEDENDARGQRYFRRTDLRHSLSTKATTPSCCK